MRNLGKWTLKGFRFEIGRREIVWTGFRKPISRRKPIRIGSTILYTRGPFGIFFKEKK